MTTEEKVKAYDKALEKVIPLYEQAKKDDCPIWSTYEYIFPELKENERMCKAALEGIEYLERILGWDAIGDTDILDVKEYLEKQKEQSFTHHEIDESLRDAVTHQMEDDGDVDDFVRRGIDDIVLKYAELGVRWQKDQRPADAKSERVIKAARRVLNNWLGGTDCPDVSGDFAELEYAIREYDGEEKQKEPHYTKRNALFDKCVENCDPKIMQRVSDEIDKMLEKEQKSAEWSEEDEKMRQRIFNHLYSLIYPNSLYGEDASECISWLKSIRPSWKPSEEQMEALKNVAFGSYQNGDGPALRELYDNLKELM